MRGFMRQGPGVLVADADPVCVGADALSALREEARTAPRKRARICAHRGAGDAVQEMIIAFTEESYVAPHRHLGKSESFHIVEGEADVVLFDERGDVLRVIRMGPPGSGRTWFYRISEPVYHTVIVRSPMLVLHEAASGPFVPCAPCGAPFAPPESDEEGSRRYRRELLDAVARRIEARG
jgi:cupin fold WbuC family metalloprotein